LIVLLFASMSGAQTTRPTPTQNWSAAVERLALALVTGDTPTAHAATTNALSVVRSGSTEAADLTTLVQRATGGAVLGTHVYSFPPLAMAADLAADFKTATTASDSIKALMIPTNDDAMQRANATAIQWVAQALGATQGTPVAVALVMPAAVAESPKSPVPVLVLMRGAAGEDGSFHISRIVFGTPLEILD
jgi:hypothetical protein